MLLDTDQNLFLKQMFFCSTAAEHKSFQQAHVKVCFGTGFVDFLGLNDCIHPCVYKKNMYIV